MNDLGGFESYSLYYALRLHFNGTYDYVKYHGKTNVTKDAFSRRKDKYSFYKLSRKYNKDELFEFYLSNFVRNPQLWITDLLQEDADSVYKNWLKKQQALSYFFEQDLDTLFEECDNPDELLSVVDGDYPKLYTMFLQGKVQFETVVILDDLLKFMSMWKKKIHDDIVFPSFSKRCEKYLPFLKYDKQKFRNILKEKVCTTVR